MNGLKKLFSPSALTATAASGMLLASAVTAWADQISVLAYTEVNCTEPYRQCSGYAPLIFKTVYWCCDTTSSHPNCAPPPSGDGHYGYCSN